MLKFLNIYVLIPFIFAFLIGICGFLKNPIYIRRIAKTMFFIQFILTFILFIAVNEENFSFLNFNFNYDSISSVLLFLTSFIFLIFSIISKTFIKKSTRLFYSALNLFLGLINTVILTDNIFLLLGCIFWIFLTIYLLNTNYSITNKKNFTKQFSADIILFLFCIILIFYNFARLFILNQIPFDFTEIKDNLYHINNTSILAAYSGFMIIIFRFLNLIPFSNKTIDNSNKTNCLISTINTTAGFFIGNTLLLKIFPEFDYIFYDLEDYIGLYLILNLIWFILLSFKDKSLVKFAHYALNVFIITNLFTLFSFEEKDISIFIYGLITIILSFAFLFIVLNIITDKFKTDKIDELPKISSKNKLLKFFIIISTLNLVKIPFFGLFSSTLITLISIFSIEYDGIILNIIPYILVFGGFLITISTLNIFYKILIEPQQINKDSLLCNHQILCLSMLLVAIIITGIYPQNFF